MQALSGAALMAVIPGFGWVSGAVVSLVTLRKSFVEALVPMIGALLVALLMHWHAGDVSQLGMVLAAVVGSLVLANTRALDWSVVATGLVAALYMVLVINLAPDKIDQLVTLYQPLFDMWSDELAKSGAASPISDMDIHNLVVEGMGLMTAFAGLAALLLARWVQGRLFNPGGFQVEFHQLRLKPAVTIGLALVLLVAQAKPEAKILLPGVLVGYFLAGLALVHGLLGRKTNTGPLLIFFYLGLVLSAGFGVMLVTVVAVVDSFVDFRNRIRKEV